MGVFWRDVCHRSVIRTPGTSEASEDGSPGIPVILEVISLLYLISVFPEYVETNL